MKKYVVNGFEFIFKAILGGSNLLEILEEQYHLSKRANISISESNEMTDFERRYMLKLLIDDLTEVSEIELRVS